jgi:hypothetical protein
MQAFLALKAKFAAPIKPTKKIKAVKSTSVPKAAITIDEAFFQLESQNINQQIAPKEPKITLSPIELTIVPASIEPEIIPAPIEPEIIPAPIEPEIIPAPIEPEIIPAPIEPEITPAPIEQKSLKRSIFDILLDDDPSDEIDAMLDDIDEHQNKKAKVEEMQDVVEELSLMELEKQRKLLRPVQKKKKVVLPPTPPKRVMEHGQLYCAFCTSGKPLVVDSERTSGKCHGCLKDNVLCIGCMQPEHFYHDERTGLDTCITCGVVNTIDNFGMGFNQSVSEEHHHDIHPDELKVKQDKDDKNVPLEGRAFQLTGFALRLRKEKTFVRQKYGAVFEELMFWVQKAYVEITGMHTIVPFMAEERVSEIKDECLQILGSVYLMNMTTSIKRVNLCVAALIVYNRRITGTTGYGLFRLNDINTVETLIQNAGAMMASTHTYSEYHADKPGRNEEKYMFIPELHKMALARVCSCNVLLSGVKPKWSTDNSRVSFFGAPSATSNTATSYILRIFNYAINKLKIHDPTIGVQCVKTYKAFQNMDIFVEEDNYFMNAALVVYMLTHCGRIKLDQHAKITEELGLSQNWLPIYFEKLGKGRENMQRQVLTKVAVHISVELDISKELQKDVIYSYRYLMDRFASTNVKENIADVICELKTFPSGKGVDINGLLARHIK